MPALTTCIVGGESLLGRELRDQLKETGFPGKVIMVGSEESSGGLLSDDEGEATVIAPLEEERLEDADVVFSTASARATHRAWELLRTRPAPPTFIDLTYTLEEIANARLRSPSVEPDRYAAVPGMVHVIAHPAATVLASVLQRVQPVFPIRHSVVQIFEPASERGQAGLNELQQQTTSLLSFKNMTTDIFDAQLSFNLLARYGEEAPEAIQTVEQRITRHLASLLVPMGNIPLPSVKLIQAPVFHGHSLSIWLDLEQRPDLSALGEAMASAQIEVRSDDAEPPTNVGVAGQPGAIVGLIEPDRNHPTAVWMWAVADNFRVMVDGAIEVARRSVPGVRA